MAIPTPLHRGRSGRNRDEHDGGSLPVLPSGFDNVPASEKPFASMRTCSSLARDIVRRRVDTAAMSSRTTSSRWERICSRSNRPVSSAQIWASTGGAALPAA